MALPLLPTTLVGSYPQPDWLVDKAMLLGKGPPRVRMTEVWRVAGPLLAQAQDDAALLAIRDMERSGLDILTDGEVRRESYFNHFATALDGIDLERPAEVRSRIGTMTQVPRVVGPIRRVRPVELESARFLRSNTDRATKITVPGPFTMTMLAMNQHYPDDRSMAMAYADAVNAELKDLKAAGIDVVQIDEPYLSPNADRARDFALEAIDRALDGVPGPTAIHLCLGYSYVVKNKPSGYAFLPELAGTRATQISIETAEPRLDLAVLRDLPGKSVMIGVLDLGDGSIESADTVAARIERALAHVSPERLIVAPDCGLKYLPRPVAFGKMLSMVQGAQKVRTRL
jgi:5-methyltetrahydropteroyltriglutamate--homocysteine methyltransferase